MTILSLFFSHRFGKLSFSVLLCLFLSLSGQIPNKACVFVWEKNFDLDVRLSKSVTKSPPRNCSQISHLRQRTPKPYRTLNLDSHPWGRSLWSTRSCLVERWFSRSTLNSAETSTPSPSSVFRSFLPLTTSSPTTATLTPSITSSTMATVCYFSVFLFPFSFCDDVLRDCCLCWMLF